MNKLILKYAKNNVITVFVDDHLLYSFLPVYGINKVLNYNNVLLQLRYLGLIGQIIIKNDNCIK